ncbi:sugar phosphate isomerase/epimerase family protein [Yoonia sp. R2331]|uniref:sugar phosphate isomerase/epimerase family protein n=1 Tax=Yoonia sp. R2331 TaxID=3237238 RepID=UPI0034E42AB7
MTGFSYQLYCSRNFGPMDQTLKMVADLGYTGVEGYGALYADPAAVAATKAALDETGLKMPSGHFGLPQLSADPEGVIAIAKALDISGIYCPFLPEDERPADAAGWADFGQQLQTIGAPFRDAGLTFGWHNHAFEFTPLADGTLPIDAILDGTDLAFEFDVAWAVVAGSNPLDTIAKYGSRITAAHVKDRAAAGTNDAEDGWADLGKGTIDWATIMTALRSAGTTHFVMEHDNPSDDARFARASLAHAKTL